MALLARRSGRPSAHFTACGCVYIILDRGDYMSSWLVFCNHIGHMRRPYNAQSGAVLALLVSSLAHSLGLLSQV